MTGSRVSRVQLPQVNQPGVRNSSGVSVGLVSQLSQDAPSFNWADRGLLVSHQALVTVIHL